ncbi:hypothetical protein ACFLQI_00255 [Candidatus Undinarchaeota archaeon]
MQFANSSRKILYLLLILVLALPAISYAQEDVELEFFAAELESESTPVQGALLVLFLIVFPLIVLIFSIYLVLSYKCRTCGSHGFIFICSKCFKKVCQDCIRKYKGKNYCISCIYGYAKKKKSRK